MKRRLTLTLVALAAGASARVLIWDNDGGRWFDDPEGHGLVGTDFAVVRALRYNGLTDIEKSSVLPPDLAAYDAVFVLCGFWPYDGRLTLAQQDILSSYLAGGGNLYLEGTDLAFRYGATTFFRLTGARFADDGRTMAEGNVNVAQGIGPWAGFSWDYYSYRTDKPDAYVDELVAEEGTAVIRSRRAGNQTNARVVRYEGEGEKPYRVIVSSLIFGALANGKHTKAELMALYLAFFCLSGDRAAPSVTPASLGRVKTLFR